MIGVIATLTARAGKQAELEAVVRELAQAVTAHEPGNLLYRLTRSRADAVTYKVLELYLREADLQAHAQSDHFRSAGPRLAACLAVPAAVELLDGV